MNQLLPAPRDLPPRRRARIRAELQRAVTQGERRMTRLAPVLAAVAALSVLGLVVWLAPWQDNQHTEPAGSAPTASTSTVQRANPVFPGLPVAEREAIERGCAQSASAGGTPRLYNLVDDEAGRYALVYTEDKALHCDVNAPAMPYNSGFAGLWSPDWLTGEMSLDFDAGSSGSASGRYAGQKGYLAVGGRITAKVARVTYTADGTTVEAKVANGTFLARIPRPSSWQIPNSLPPGIVRAYDAGGALLAAFRDPEHPVAPCYVTPDKTVIPGDGERTPDPATCVPATRWR